MQKLLTLLSAKNGSACFGVQLCIIQYYHPFVFYLDVQAKCLTNISEAEKLSLSVSLLVIYVYTRSVTR